MNFSALPGAHLPTSQPMSEKRHGATYGKEMDSKKEESEKKELRDKISEIEKEVGDTRSSEAYMSGICP